MHFDLSFVSSVVLAYSISVLWRDVTELLLHYHALYIVVLRIGLCSVLRPLNTV